MKHTLLSLALTCALPVLAQTYYGNGYTIVEGMNDPQPDLNARVFKSIRATNLGEGLAQLLDGSGWALASPDNADPALWRLYGQPYPEYKRTLHPMPLAKALQYLAGDAWDLVVDPVNRLVSFEVNSGYRTVPTPTPTPTPTLPPCQTLAAPPAAAAGGSNEGFDMGIFLENVQKPRGRGK